MTVKFLHCADVHLDTPFKGLSRVNSGLAKSLKDVSKKVLENIIDVAITQQVDFMLIAGDLFDSEQKSLQSQLRCKAQFEKLSKQNIKVYIIGGNHDPLNKPLNIKWPENVCFFPPGTPTTMEHEIMGKNIYIHGVSYKAPEEVENKLLSFPKRREAGINIGLIHCEIGQGGPYSPCTLSELKGKGYDYWALGHIHKRSILLTEPYIIYPGSPQGKSIKEDKEKGCYVITVDGDTWSTEFIATHEVLWVQEDISIDNLTLDELMDKLQQKLMKIESKATCSGVIVRFLLKGRGLLHSLTTENLKDMVHEINEQEDFLDKFIWVESIQKSTIRDLDLVAMERQEDFLGTFLKLQKQYENQEDMLSNLVGELDILSNRKIKKYSGEIQQERLLENAKDLVINMLLRGE